MRRRKKNKSPKNHRSGWWASLDVERRRRVMRGTAAFIATLALLATGSLAVTRLEAHVEQQQLRAFPDARIEFTDLPSSLHAVASADLHHAVAGLLDGAWTDPQLCQRIAARVATVGWVERVRYVRRHGDASFEVRAVYRLPAAMVQREAEFFLVDRHAVRLPGQYRYDETWPLIQGVQAPTPGAGETWSGDDLRAGLAVVHLLRNEPFAKQITAVLVDNFGGRLNRLKSHLELATDRAGGRIRWGSAPGREFEENTAATKIALLRANYSTTGRCDAGYPVIDVSTYPDRFTVPQ